MRAVTKALAKTLLSLRGRMSEETRDAVKTIIHKVVEDILRQIRNNFRQSLTGRRNRFRRSLVQIVVTLIGVPLLPPI